MDVNQKPVALVLGGTAPHIVLINHLKKRGYYVVLLDYLDNPPAKAHAHLHVQESTLDMDKVLEVAKELNTQLVISSSIDQANVTACYVAEQMGLTKPYSYETALAVSNKGKMKEMMRRNGVPTSRFVYVEYQNELEQAGLKWPLMVKPADACGSAGVKKVKNQNELAQYFEFAKTISRTDKVIVEEVVEGLEVSAYCFIEKGEARLLMMSERLSVANEADDVIKCYATITPPDISTHAKKRIVEAAQQVADMYGLDNTPLHIQAFVSGETIHVIEFAPRAGGGISHETIFDETGFDIIDATIDSFLEVPHRVEIQPSGLHQAIGIIYALPGVFVKVTGMDKLMEEGLVKAYYGYKPPHTNIQGITASKCRIGAYVVKAHSKKELFNSLHRVVNSLDVLNEQGESMYDKGIYESIEAAYS
ncbi:MAG: ATP-grasp domain-containing protein [Cryomorphaceae bacterium]|nr:MAG: ATP-grasp domain-containing protein [Cryomorphaceae bacterium]